MAGGAKSKTFTNAATHHAQQRSRVGSQSNTPDRGGGLASLNHVSGNRAVASLFTSARPSPLPGEALPLDSGLRSSMESRFGADLGEVKIHAGPGAARLAKERRARAFTEGQNIVFGTGEFSPYEPEGRRLLTHELAHVVQQSLPGGVVAGQAHEREAEAAGALASGSGRIPVNLAAVPGTVQRSPLEENSVLELRDPTVPKSPPDLTADDLHLDDQIDQRSEWLGRQRQTTPEYLKYEQELKLLDDEKRRRNKNRKHSQKKKTPDDKHTAEREELEKPRTLYESAMYKTSGEVEREIGLIQAWLKQPNVNKADRQLLAGTLAELRQLYRYMRKAERHSAGVNAAIASSVDLGAEKEEEIKDKAEFQATFGGPSPEFVLERERAMSLIRKIDGMYQQPDGGWVLMRGREVLVLEDAEAAQLRAGIAQILDRADKSARDMNEDSVFKAEQFMDANYDQPDAEGVRKESSRAGVVVRLASGVDAGELLDKTIAAVASSNVVLGERKKRNATVDIVGPQEKRAQTIFEGVALADRARRIVDSGIEKSLSTAEGIVTGLTIVRNTAIGMEAALATGGIAGELVGAAGLTGLPAEAATNFAAGFASGTTVARVEGKSWGESLKTGAWSGLIAVPSGFVGSRVTGVAGKVLGNSKVARLAAGTLGDLAGGATGFYMSGGGSSSELKLNLGLGVVTGRLGATVSHPPEVAPKGETHIEPVAHSDPHTELSLPKPTPSMALGAVQGPPVLAHPPAEIPAIPPGGGTHQPHSPSAPHEPLDMRGVKEPGGHRIRGESEVQERAAKETSFDFEGQQVEIKGVVRSKWKKQWAKGEAATLSEPVGADVDETAAVGAKNISKSKQYRRATNPMNKSFMDSVTNRVTKWTREYRPTGKQEPVAGKGQVSLAKEPEALFTKRIGEVKELRELHDRAVAKYANRRDLKPTDLKNEINGEFRRLIKEDHSEAAKAARSALLKAGWDPATIRPTTRNTSIPRSGELLGGSNPLSGTSVPPPGGSSPPGAGTPPPTTSTQQSAGSKNGRKVFIDSQTLIYISDGNHPEAEAALRRMKEQGAELHITKQSHNELFQMPEKFENPQTEKDKLLVPKIQESFVRREAKLKELGITPVP
jgi:hypothetical protein